MKEVRQEAFQLTWMVNLLFKAAPGATLQISYLGYGSKTVKASSNMEVVLKEDNALLDELVVVGYGQQKKVNLTGAVSTVDLDQALGSRPEADVTKSFARFCSGFDYYE